MNADEPSQLGANARAIFTEVVRSCAALLDSVRERAIAATVRESLFDHTYIEFLTEQIQVGPRGPEWIERLRQRRAALEPYCGVRLLDGHIELSSDLYTIYVHPDHRHVVHWELYEGVRNA